ncbi:hypothetical protein Cci01nite_57350 [Catellatospora citrea]|uniref:Uncharacterized protein n=1 Tax=Catellatospora citrea TaxID=53366 RepID=A0A8J3KCG5_9ACTN|nr:hypothetical protein C8E86_4699 [Catellatospora citrea]GIG00642.1 hypothetical protein Cci01nite_57350 [Catellatospora citrea]
MTTQTAPLPGRPTTEAGLPPEAEHHRQPEPDEHLCTCGRLRDDCVRDTIRDLWHPPIS